MPRKAREKSGTGLYHVMAGGVNRQNIFVDDSDRERFLDCINSAKSHVLNISGRKAGKFEIYAYALMGNHFHLLVHVIEGELGEFIKKIASGYVLYFNKKYGRFGHLFRERFRSEPCDSFEYFRVLMGYIHQNPIKHGFSESISGYKYTSWKEYFKPEETDRKLCDVSYALSRMTRNELVDAIEEMIPPDKICVDIDQFRGQMSDAALLDFLRNNYNLAEPCGIKELPKTERIKIIRELKEYGGAVRQISRLTGLDKMLVSRVK